MSFVVVLFLFSVVHVWSLNNGLGLTPQMGYNSWYDVLMTPSEQQIKDTVAALISTGLYKAGYHYVNLDDGMVSFRDSDGVLHPDPKFFPSGFQALADFIHQNGMKFGVYTDRGNTTCGGRPAAFGHEMIDAQTYAKWGVDYVKEDSCDSPQDHQTAYAEYAAMRDALNATGRPIFFSLCGWNNWYAPVGHSLGNSWRIGPDDTNWNGILTNIDIMAPLWPYAGPGGWNDPCLLLGRDAQGAEAVTDLQGRAQFSMWAIMAAPLLLSQNIRNLTQYQLETYLNTEVIAVSQDPLGRQGQKLMGGNLSSGTNSQLTLQTCTSQNPYQIWQWNDTSAFFVTNPKTTYCVNIDNCGTQLIAYPCVTSGGTCVGPNDYSNEQFYLVSDGTLRTKMNNYCVTHNGLQSTTYISPCINSQNQQWVYDSSYQIITSLKGSACLTIGSSGSRNNVWGRPLDDGSWAIAFINADVNPVTLTCDSNCLSPTGWESTQVLKVRDLWAHEDLPNTTVLQGITTADLPPNGGIAMFRITPIWSKK